MKKKIAKLFKKNEIDKEVTDGLSPGTPAPDFSLLSTNGQNITLGQYQGRPVVLVFYPRDDTPVCSEQLALYNEALHLFDEYEAQLLAISVDDIASHKGFSNRLKLKFPLLSDDNPPGKITDKYGVFNHKDGKSERALFVIDQVGNIHWSEVSPRSVNPGAQGILTALEEIK